MVLTAASTSQGVPDAAKRGVLCLELFTHKVRSLLALLLLLLFLLLAFSVAYSGGNRGGRSRCGVVLRRRGCAAVLLLLVPEAALRSPRQTEPRGRQVRADLRHDLRRSDPRFRVSGVRKGTANWGKPWRWRWRRPWRWHKAARSWKCRRCRFLSCSLLRRSTIIS